MKVLWERPIAKSARMLGASEQRAFSRRLRDQLDGFAHAATSVGDADSEWQ